MNFEDYETLPTNCITTNMTAGAMAGIMEHCVMYPLDSVKVNTFNLWVQNREISLRKLYIIVQPSVHFSARAFRISHILIYRRYES